MSSTSCRRRVELWDRLADLDQQMLSVEGLELLGPVGVASDLSCGDGSSRRVVVVVGAPVVLLVDVMGGLSLVVTTLAPQ